jgi:radical SAM-linked protein
LLGFVKAAIVATGYDEITFSSLSCGDYKGLDSLLIETNKLYGDRKIKISLPSLRCNENSINIAQYINADKKPTLTFAPEAGTDRLRNVIGKNLSQKQIVGTLLAANKMGWETIKLYFMIGLPTETQEDLEGIKKLIDLVRSQSKNLKFTITISPFVPKAQTAFQWHSMDRVDKIDEKIKFLRGIKGVDIKAHNSRSIVLEAFIAKGDRRTGKVIYNAWKKGTRFDQWADKLGNDFWQEAITESGLDLDFYVYRQPNKDEVFAWDHLDFGIDKKTLYEDYVKGLACDSQIKDDLFNKEHANFPDNFTQPEREAIPPKMRVRLRIARKGIVRFISHLEQIETFRRAIRRSGLPIAFSEGFSPQIKASYGPPLPVGQESSSEYIDLCLIEKVAMDYIKEALSKTLPLGFTLLDIKRIPVFFASIDSLVNMVEYKISNIEISQKEIDNFMSQDKIIICRQKKGKTLELDVKTLIKEIKIKDKALFLKMYYGQNKAIKPDLVLRKMHPSDEGRYLIERTNLYIETEDGCQHIL